MAQESRLRGSRIRGRAPEPFERIVERYRPRIEAELGRALSRETRALSRFGAAAELLPQALHCLASRGGKRLRALLVAVGAHAVGVELSVPVVARLGAALEILHAYLLIHDDWIDADHTRRGGPSIHRLLSDGLSSERLGERVAVLTGDYGSALSLLWLLELKLAPKLMLSVVRIYAEMHAVVIAGQARDVLSVTSDVETTYLLKTASYSTVGPLMLGATLGHAKRAELAFFREYGTLLGVAFQHQDDLLGAFGTEARTGKPIGSDLRQGKITALVVAGRQSMSVAERRVFDRAFGNLRATPSQLRAALAVLERSSGPAWVQARIAEQLTRAAALLERGPLSQEGKLLLDSMAKTLVDRQT